MGKKTTKQIIDLLKQLNIDKDDLDIRKTEWGSTIISLQEPISGFSIGKNGLSSYFGLAQDNKQNLDLLREIQSVTDVMKLALAEETPEKSMKLLRNYKKINHNFKEILQFIVRFDNKFEIFTKKVSSSIIGW